MAEPYGVCWYGLRALRVYRRRVTEALDAGAKIYPGVDVTIPNLDYRPLIVTAFKYPDGRVEWMEET